jgi:hypothetical protein
MDSLLHFIHLHVTVTVYITITFVSYYKFEFYTLLWSSSVAPTLAVVKVSTDSTLLCTVYGEAVEMLDLDISTDVGTNEAVQSRDPFSRI